MTRTCATCRFGQITQRPPGSITAQRICHRFPPSILVPGPNGSVGFLQPFVGDTLTCGEWTAGPAAGALADPYRHAYPMARGRC